MYLFISIEGKKLEKTYPFKGTTRYTSFNGLLKHKHNKFSIKMVFRVTRVKKKKKKHYQSKRKVLVNHFLFEGGTHTFHYLVSIVKMQLTYLIFHVWVNFYQFLLPVSK